MNKALSKVNIMTYDPQDWYLFDIDRLCGKIASVVITGFFVFSADKMKVMKSESKGGF